MYGSTPLLFMGNITIRSHGINKKISDKYGNCLGSQEAKHVCVRVQITTNYRHAWSHGVDTCKTEPPITRQTHAFNKTSASDFQKLNSVTN